MMFGSSRMLIYVSVYEALIVFNAYLTLYKCKSCFFYSVYLTGDWWQCFAFEDWYKHQINGTETRIWSSAVTLRLRRQINILCHFHIFIVPDSIINCRLKMHVCIYIQSMIIESSSTTALKRCTMLKMNGLSAVKPFWLQMFCFAREIIIIMWWIAYAPQL